METSTRIHLGCGDKLWPRFINVDFDGADVNTDIRKLPFPDNYADEIHLIHVFEHLHRMQVDAALQEWKRVLKPGGKLAMEMPCLDKVAEFLAAGAKDLKRTLFALYGDVRLNRPEMLHQWCWSKAEIASVLANNGFVKIEHQEPFFHYPDRDLRIVAFKPEQE